jgi:hypothetical protein
MKPRPAPHRDRRLALPSLGAAGPPLCPPCHPPQSVAACLSLVARRILSRMGGKSRETIYGASVRRRQSGRRKHVREPTGSPVRRGTSACSAFRDRRSHRRHWAMRSMPGSAISKSNALAATRIRPLPSTSCGDRRQRRSMSWSATCAADNAPKSGAVPTSGAMVALRATKISAIDPSSRWWPGER